MVRNQVRICSTGAANAAVSVKHSLAPPSITPSGSTRFIRWGDATLPLRIVRTTASLRGFRLPFIALGTGAASAFHQGLTIIGKRLSSLGNGLRLSSAGRRAKAAFRWAYKGGSAYLARLLSDYPSSIGIAWVCGALPLGPGPAFKTAAIDAFRCATRRIAMYRLGQHITWLTTESADDCGHLSQKEPPSGWAILLRDRTSNPVGGMKKRPSGVRNGPSAQTLYQLAA